MSEPRGRGGSGTTSSPWGSAVWPGSLALPAVTSLEGNSAMRYRGAVVLAVLFAAVPLSGAVYTVDSTGDEPDATLNGICATAGGACTLRAALQEAENAGADTVAFNIPGAVPHTIPLTGPLGVFDAGTTIDGYTQPGSQPNTTATGALDAAPQIVVTGAPNENCFRVYGDNTVIRGLVINGCVIAITVLDFFSATPGVVVAGNFIGTDAGGMVAVPSLRGVHLAGVSDYVYATVGGTNPADRNLISGNDRSGVSFGGYASVLVQGNVIGLNKTATAAVPNGRGIEDGNSAGHTTITTIGGFGPGEANIISGNTVAGILLQNTGHQATIRGNAIHGNAGLGIDLHYEGPTPNDPSDADTEANDIQNFPIITSIETLTPQGTGTRIQGVLHSAPDTTYDLDFYENAGCSNFPREFLEGEVYIGSNQVTTDGAGEAIIDVTIPVSVAAGARIAATATDPSGNTSEFSQRILFSVSPTSGPAAGGTIVGITGTDLTDPTTLTFGGVAANVTFVNDHQLTTSSPALEPGTVNDIVASTAEGLGGTLIKGWVADFLDVPGGHIFYDFVTKLVSNGITVGVGGGLYGVTQDTRRQQMAVFLLRAKHGLCFVPPPCTVPVFDDVPCASIFAPWINELVAQGITGGCGNGDNYCPTNPVLRQQMAVLLLRTLEGTAYTPPACTVESFPDVPCSSPFAAWIYELVARNITAGCGAGLYCPAMPANRGQMATFLVKTFSLQ